MDQRSGDCRFSGRIIIFAINCGQQFAEFRNVGREDRLCFEQDHPELALLSRNRKLRDRIGFYEEVRSKQKRMASNTTNKEGRESSTTEEGERHTKKRMERRTSQSNTAHKGRGRNATQLRRRGGGRQEKMEEEKATPPTRKGFEAGSTAWLNARAGFLHVLRRCLPLSGNSWKNDTGFASTFRHRQPL